MLKVMVVDDDPDIRAALRICLGSEGFEVQSCADGQDAINSLDAGALPQAMILDLMMPRMNGFEVLEVLKLKAAWSRIPVANPGRESRWWSSRRTAVTPPRTWAWCRCCESRSNWKSWSGPCAPSPRETQPGLPGEDSPVEGGGPSRIRTCGLRIRSRPSAVWAS